MQILKLEIAIKNGFKTWVLVKDSKQIMLEINRVVNETKRLEDYVELLERSVRSTTSLLANGVLGIDANNLEEYKLIVDIRSQTVIDWVESYKSGLSNQSLFLDLLYTLDNIPIVVNLINEGANLACALSNTKTFNKAKKVPTLTAEEMFNF